MDATRLHRWADPRLIVVATNLADESALVWQAASQARETGSKVLLVHALRPPSLQARLNPGPASGIRTPQGSAAWNTLLHMAKMIEWEGAPCEPVLLEGDPAEQVPAFVRKRGADRVIVATRGASGLERLLAGSVAEALMSAVEVPVCVIGPGAAANPFRGTTGGQVLLTLSLHHNRADCLHFAALFANRRHASLTIMHAVDMAGMDQVDKYVARGVAHSSLVALASTVRDPMPDFEITIREGRPARAILDEEVCFEWDFIIMGSSSHGLVSKVLGTSVVQRVIAEARCPIITVRPPELGTEVTIPEEEEVQYAERQDLVVGSGAR